jgi:large subunit ribosomal protein L5
MRRPYLYKLVVNIGVGESGARLEKAQRVLKILTGTGGTQTLSKETNRDFGIRERQAIGAKVTLRGAAARDFLKRALWVKNNRITPYSFDAEGNFHFGIPDYTGFEGVKYDPDIGIFGLNVVGVLRRKGARVRYRAVMARAPPKPHRVTKPEAIRFLREEFSAEVVQV